MAVYEVQGTFLVRTATPAEWASTTTKGVGGRRVLGRGEIGFEIGTSNFKIGDGEQEYQYLPYIQPIPSSSPYALRLGTEGASYSYDELKGILDDISGGGSGSLVERVDTLESKIQDAESWMNDNQNKFFTSTSEFPTVGVQGPLYIDTSTGNAYYFNIDEVEGKPIGYIKLTNSFKTIICGLN